MTRSPLKDNPLHNPGQSLEEEMHRIVDDFYTGTFMTASFITLLAVVEWIRWAFQAQIHPIVPTVIALITWAYFGFRLVQVRRRTRELKQGRDGEKAVGQYLERFRESGAVVFHDIPAKDFNVDHVVIAPQGLFVIETKTISKPAQGKAEIHVANGRIIANGREIERNPIDQAVAISRWLQSELHASTGKDFPVQPVLVFPGWFVHRIKRDAAKGAWVLNPKALPAFIGSEPERIAPEDVKLASYHLSRYVRSNGQTVH